MSVGIWQILLILAIVMILFGAGKLPTVMHDLGKGIKNFKAGLNSDETTPVPVKIKAEKPSTDAE